MMPVESVALMPAEVLTALPDQVCALRDDFPDEMLQTLGS